MNANIRVREASGVEHHVAIDRTDTVMQLKVKIAGKVSQNHKNIKLLFNGTELGDFQNFVQAGIKEGDVVNLVLPHANLASQTHGGGVSNPFAAFGAMGGQQMMQQSHQNRQAGEYARLRSQAEALRNEYLNDSNKLAGLLNNDPELAQAICSDSIEDTVNFIAIRVAGSRERKRKELEEIRRLESDPFNPEAQKKIEEIIKQQRMDEQLKYAEEYMPETLIATSMLYIDMEVNGKKFQGFVDSGAQMTVMSAAFVQEIGLMKDVDTRYKGKASGVGTSEIIGKIHACRLKIGGKYLIECSISVLTSIDIPFLLGLDMLKKHRCAIDLGSHSLKFPGDGGREAFEVPFVPDHLIERKGELALKSSLSNSQISSNMTDESKEQIVKNLAETTGVSNEIARKALEECKWNAELAGAQLMGEQ
jgi:DNA damage-inducible protein 1